MTNGHAALLLTLTPTPRIPSANAATAALAISLRARQSLSSAVPVEFLWSKLHDLPRKGIIVQARVGRPSMADHRGLHRLRPLSAAQRWRRAGSLGGGGN